MQSEFTHRSPSPARCCRIHLLLAQSQHISDKMYRHAPLHRSCRLASAPVPAPGSFRQRSQRGAAAAANTLIFKQAAQLNTDSDSDSDTNGSEDGSSGSDNSSSHRESSQDNGNQDNYLRPGDTDSADASTPHPAMPTPTQQPPQQSAHHHQQQHKRPFCSSGHPSRKKAKPPVPHSPVSAAHGRADPAGTGPTPAVRFGERAHKIRPAALAGTHLASRQQLEVILVHAFAGTDPVAQVVELNNLAGPHACLRVVALVSIEIEDTAETRPPEVLGLSADRYLRCRGRTRGDVGSPVVQQKVAEFVQRHLQAGTVHAVLVFGGPPCTEYSSAKLLDPSIARETAARHAYQVAMTNHATAPGGTGVLRAEWERAASDADRAAWREFADRQAADKVVKEFIMLYKMIEIRCHRHRVKSYMLMENPYSGPERGLWNRAFMKKDHLVDLPDQPRARAIVHRPEPGTWLYSRIINWCVYGPAHPMKPTVVFTNLRDFPDLKCDHGGCPHETTVRGLSNKADRAAWPLGFVRTALLTVVTDLRPGLLQQTRDLLEQTTRSRGRPQVPAPPRRGQPSHLGNTSRLGNGAAPLQLVPGQRAAQQDRITHVTGTTARAPAGANQPAMVRTATDASNAAAAAVAEEDDAIIIDSSDETESDDGLDLSDDDFDDDDALLQ